MATYTQIDNTTFNNNFHSLYTAKFDQKGTIKWIKMIFTNYIQAKENYSLKDLWFLTFTHSHTHKTEDMTGELQIHHFKICMHNACNPKHFITWL